MRFLLLKLNIAPVYNPKISAKYDNKQLLDEAEHDQLRIPTVVRSFLLSYKQKGKKPFVLDYIKGLLIKCEVCIFQVANTFPYRPIKRG